MFFSTFKLSACTFGGGFVIIPLMRKKFVEELGWIDEDEMLDLTAIAQSSPGAIAVNASILVGYHVAGCQTAHCGRRKPHFDFGGNTSPIVPYRHLPQTLRGLTADCRSLV